MYDAIVIQNRIIEELTKEYSEYLEKEREQLQELKDKIESLQYELKEERNY